jgi:hypothetical protein
MTYAIRRENGDVLYFDAIMNVEEQYTATVTKHPIASGAFISDHTIIDNNKFNLKAVLSDADFNLNRPQRDYYTNLDTIGLAQSSVTFPVGQPKQFVNNTETQIPVKIVNNGAKWRSFLPEVVSQFTANTIPTVIVTPQSKVKTANAVRFEMLDMFQKKEAFTLVEYNGNLIARSWANVIFTNISFAEDADTGLGLYPIMQMEQVMFTNVENVQIKMKTTPNKGRKTGVTTKKPEQAGDNATTTPTNNAEKTAAAALSDKAAGSTQ